MIEKTHALRPQGTPYQRTRWRPRIHSQAAVPVSDDVARFRDFYTGVLGGQAALDGEPTIVKLANGWVTINVGGGPTDDKPEVILEPPGDPNHVSAFLNIRVADIQAAYREWRAKGAEFLTEPKDHGREIRCYMRDPDGHLIEVGQTTRAPDRTTQESTQPAHQESTYQGECK